jgi:hypothetical protein
MEAGKGYRDLTNLVGMVKLLIVILGILSAAGLWSGSLELDLLQRIRDGGEFTDSEAENSDTRQSVLGVLYLLVYIPTAVVFLRWVYLTNRNARALAGDDLKFTPGWAVGWYFVPVATLWKPYQAMKEMFRASNPDYADNWRDAPFPKYLPLWWGLWIVSGILGQVIIRRSFRSNTLDEMVALSHLVRLSDLVDVFLMGVVFAMVSRLADLQVEKRQRTQLAGAA